MESFAAYPGPAKIDIDRVSKAKPLSLRALYFLQLWGFKALVRSYLLSTQYVTGLPAAVQPTYTKLYPSSPGIEAQVYIPKTYKAGDAPLPLLIDIHGGGFAIGAPVFDARDNARFAHKHGFAVVSIGYRLAPSHPFPAAVHDVADQIKEVLDDEDLPVDRSKVALIGYSAGGNLALTAVQLHGLHERIQASVAYYPAVDFVITPDEREQWRTAHPDGRADVLARSSHFFTWGYVGPGTELRQPILSPRFADRGKLPKNLFLLGCEYDMLCHDAWSMAEELAEKQGLARKNDGRGGDQSWESGALRWRRIMGVEHGFNLMVPTKKGDEATLYRDKADDVAADVADWLRRVAFGGK